MLSISQIAVSSIPSQDLGVVLVVVALFLTLRVYRGMKGMRYSSGRVYMTPLIYFILLVIGLAALNPSYTDIAAVAAAVIIGYLIGRRLAGGAKFFDKNGVTYYRRSPTIMVIWLVSFMARFGMEFVTIPGITYLALAIEVVLAATTGMIIGEAHHINNAYAEYASGSVRSK